MLLNHAFNYDEGNLRKVRAINVESHISTDDLSSELSVCEGLQSIASIDYEAGFQKNPSGRCTYRFPPYFSESGQSACNAIYQSLATASIDRISQRSTGKEEGAEKRKDRLSSIIFGQPAALISAAIGGCIKRGRIKSKGMSCRDMLISDPPSYLLHFLCKCVLHPANVWQPPTKKARPSRLRRYLLTVCDESVMKGWLKQRAERAVGIGQGGKGGHAGAVGAAFNDHLINTDNTVNSKTFHANGPPESRVAILAQQPVSTQSV